MQHIFFDDGGILRSGWRAGIFLAAFIFFAMLFAALVALILDTTSVGAPEGSAAFMISYSLAPLLPAIFVGWLCGKYLEGVPFTALGIQPIGPWFGHWLAGLALGGATLMLAVLIAVVFGGLRFGVGDLRLETVTSLALAFVVFAVAAAFEEVLFRGYLLQTFARAGLAWLAVLLTSAFFGVVHMGNPDTGIISTLNSVLAGIWFALAYLKTRDLYFVWGLHLAWNWMQGSFFGIEVSGLAGIAGESLLKEVDTGPTWLTGQTYGIEGGVACTVAILASISAIYLFPAGFEVGSATKSEAVDTSTQAES
ncbi:MAG: type II CAAX endopeptidase family protein [Pyrinomonadaceae bacterium]